MLVRHYLSLVILFILEKPLFMLYAGGISGGYGAGQWLQVMIHGVGIDTSVAAYLTLLPVIAAVLSIIWESFPIRTVMKAYDGIVSVLLSLIFIGDAALYPFWGYKLDASVLFYLKTPKEALASVQPVMAILGILLVVFVAWLFFRYLVLSLSGLTMENRPAGRKALRASGTFLLLLPLFLAIRGGVSESTMNVGHAYFSKDSFLNHSAVNPAFSLISSLSKTDDYSKWYEYFDEEERSQLADSLFILKPAECERLLRVSKPDILLVILEGFGADFIGGLGGMEQVSRNFDRISAEGISFDSCYAGSYRTDRGLVCLVNGFPGLPTVSVMKMPVKCSRLPSIPRALSDEGYTCDFIYGGDINFTNMNSWLFGAGYSKVISSIDFSVHDRHGSAWGANDDVVFSRVLHEISKRDMSEEPWFTTVLSLSSHEPFEVPYNGLPDMIPNAFAFTDSCLGSMIDSLRVSPQWDNLLVVITADHGFRYPPEGHAQAAHVHHIPFVLTGGAVSCGGKRYGMIMNQTDIAATLLEQLGVDHSDFRYGRNVLSQGYDNPFAFYTFNNGFGYIDNDGYVLFDANAGIPVETDGNDSTVRLRHGKALLQSLHDNLSDL